MEKITRILSQLRKDFVLVICSTNFDLEIHKNFTHPIIKFQKINYVNVENISNTCDSMFDLATIKP